MSNGVNFRELALDLRRQLTEAQAALAAHRAKGWCDVWKCRLDWICKRDAVLGVNTNNYCRLLEFQVMTNTIPNVPRELLERICTMDFMGLDIDNEVAEIRALLSAPSPAGVDGLDGPDYGDGPEFEGWAERSGSEAAKLLLPALRQYMHNDGSGLLAGYDLETTKAIIAGLRSAVADLYKTLRDGVSELSTLQSYVREVAVEDEDEESLEVCDATEESIEHMQRVLDGYRHLYTLPAKELP